MLLPLGISISIMYFFNWQHRSKVNPLTRAMPRLPGSQLGRELGSVQLNIGMSLLTTAMGVYLPGVAYLLFKINGEQTLLVSLVLTGCVILVYGLVVLVKSFKRIKILRLGYECELAVGQELNLLMHQGFHVFHDIPADGFNIDHIVVGKNGVFAVETKGRSKRLGTASDNKAEHRLDYENGVLKFPGWQETKPIEQAIRQAKWASDWLSKATGTTVLVKPVVVLPGWFINIKSKPRVPVLAAGQISTAFRSLPGQKLSDQQFKQVVYQADQKVRDLAPGEIVRPADAK